MKTIIVEDNPHAAQVIQTILTESGEKIEICGIAENVGEAADLIRSCAPQLWLLDIRLKNELIFDLFDQIDARSIEQSAIIFITAYQRSDYLHKAIKASAFDFIFKPIDKQELLSAVKSAGKSMARKDLQTRLDRLEKEILKLNKERNPEKFPIYRVNGVIDYPAAQEVLYLEADQSICRFFMTDGSIISSVRNLGFYKDGIIRKLDFIPISKKHVVNPRHILSYDPIQREVALKNGAKLEVSRRNGSKLREYFHQILR